MADGVLLVGRQLGHGAAERGNEEDRVVAKAAGAARLARDGAFERALNDLIEAARTRLRQGDGTAVARGALIVGNGGQAAEEDAEALRIGRRLAGPARGVDARLAAQRVNLEAGVVREGGEASGFSECESFEDSVQLEGRAGLVHADAQAQVSWGDECDGEIGVDGAELFDLVRVGGGKDDAPRLRHVADLSSVSHFSGVRAVHLWASVPRIAAPRARHSTMRRAMRRGGED